MSFQKAIKEQTKLHMAISGISGAGKSLTSLLLAREFGPKIAAIDTETTLSHYANVVPFDVQVIRDEYSPTKLIELIGEAESGGYDSIVIDSGSLFWTGKSGFLDMALDLEKRGKGNSYTVWKLLTPLYQKFCDAIGSSKIHTFFTMREKTEHEMKKDERGKTSIQKLGLSPIMRDQFEYLFDVYGSLNSEHELTVHKSRCIQMIDGKMTNMLDNKIFLKPGKDLADILKKWMSDGAVRAEVPVVKGEKP